MNPDLPPQPGRILALGDVHGNTNWTVGRILSARAQLREEPFKLLLQAGDFGVWPGHFGGKFLYEVSQALEKADASLWFIDGNHECFPLLDTLRCGKPGIVPIDAAQRIWHLPRGTRWTWHGRTWMALGGAVSIDKAQRIEGRDWWPEEAITAAQAQEACAGGPCDVLLSHDCPSGVRHSFGPIPRNWDQRDADASEEHRAKLQGVVNTTRPSHIIHGHLHRGYSRMCDFGYGNVSVTGLDMDGERFNAVALDTRTMTWMP